MRASFFSDEEFRPGSGQVQGRASPNLMVKIATQFARINPAIKQRSGNT